MFTLLWPIFPFILQICLFGFWGAQALFLASVGSPQYGEANKTTANLSVFLNGQLTYQNTTVVEALINAIPCDPNVSTPPV